MSSSGFSEQAKNTASHYGIGLRFISEITISDINPIMNLDFVLFNHKKYSIAQVGVRRFHNLEWKVPRPEDIDFMLVPYINPQETIFWNVDTNKKWSLNDLWYELQEACDPFVDIERGAPPVVRTACFPYPGNVIVDTGVSQERIGDIIFSVSLVIEVEQITIEEANKIRYSGTGNTDLQRIEFSSSKCSKGEWSLALQMPSTSNDVNQLNTRMTTPTEKKGPN